MFRKFFSQKVHRRVYLDYAAATPISERAKQALLQSLTLTGNPSSIYKEGVEAKDALIQSRKEVASLISAQPYEIYFTSSATESIALAINGIVDCYHAMHPLSERLPHVITSCIEHPAVLETVRHLEKKKRIIATYLPVTREGFIEVKTLREALTEETILVTLMYVNNELGTVQPVKEVGRALQLYREEKARVRGGTPSVYPYYHIDACQAFNYFPCLVSSLRVDLLTLNSSKVYGPRGVALLYKKEGVHLSPITRGGGQERGLRSGTEAVPQIVAFKEALVEAQLTREKESKRLYEIRKRTIASIKERLLGAVIYGSEKEACQSPSIINLRVPGMLSEEIILRLDAQGFAVSHKSACASESESGSYVVKALGEEDAATYENIRISMGRSTTEGDMRSFIKVLVEIVGKYAR